ncbi:hypothetical protein ABT063_01955 [Streptomyces sp. NPDC002838]|uniref:hypothetical protein n=1 Tax=Streptomyces sp. NPDC002838 TaxID=3154436 RepID=UPI003328654E
MSRGHGRVERAVIEQVTAAPAFKGVAMSKLAAAVYAVEEPTRSQLVSTRRAVRKLAEEGVVETYRDPSYPNLDRTYQRRGRKGAWCTAEGERYQLRGRPGYCPHCEGGLPRHDDGDGSYHVPLVTVAGVVETWVCRPRSSITNEEHTAARAEIADIMERLQIR